MTAGPGPGLGGSVPLWRIRALARRAGFRLRDRLGRPDPAGAIAAAEARLQARPGPLRVGFVVCDAAKWSAGPLLARLVADPDFTVTIHPALSDTTLRLGRAERRAVFGRLCDFFAGVGPMGGALYDPGRDRVCELSAIAADLVFIQQPWGMQDLPRRLLARGILSAYIHYGFPIVRNDRMQFGLPDFHRFLWSYVAASDLHRDMVAGGPAPPHRVVVAGYPKFDIYRDPPPDRSAVPHWPRPDQPERRRVIFAPHHTLDGGLNLGTFAWSGPALLALARARPEIDFLLKPHPNLSQSQGRARQAFDTWQQDWSALPNTARFEDGDYFGIFRTSDIMITDSGSFLAEYLPTGRPVLRLTRPDGAPMNAAGQALLPGFYTADTPAALTAGFARIVLDGADPLHERRAALAALLLPAGPEGAAGRVVADLRASLRPAPDSGPIPAPI